MEVGGHAYHTLYTWQLPWLAVDLALAGRTLLAQTGVETTPLPLYMHHFW